MIINEKDSAVFITFLKESLIEEIKMKGGSEEVVNHLKESSDAVVLSLIAYGKIAEGQDETIVKEAALEKIKQIIIENHELFNVIDIDQLHEFDSSIGCMNYEASEVLSESWFKNPLEATPMRQAINSAHDKYFGKMRDFGEWMRKNIGREGGQLAANVIAFSVLIGAISYFSYKTYKRYLSKAGRQCHNLTGFSKNKCIRQAEIVALENQVSEIKKNSSACSKTKDPTKCKNALNAKIKKIEDKIKARKAVNDGIKKH